MKEYHATVTRTLICEFTFTDEDIEDADSPEEAAGELLYSQPDWAWDLDYEDIIISESIYVE